ncbi:MAG: aminotransferase class I/II-fold pyridoxal phosphate-dependent enzyme, partial [Pseudomonadota bacterium]
AFDFASLPRAKTLSMQHAAMETVGLSNPFFRVHDGAPGPEPVISGAPRISFSSYNYLGLNGHPKVAAAAKDAIDRYGVSAMASRVVGGERPYHRALEERLAAHYGTEDAVVMVSGHATNVTTVGTLLDQDDLILMDQLSHNSIAEGAKLSRAHRLVFPHNDYDWLEERLTQIRGRHRHVLIAVEGLYSMDGDSPDLARLIEIKRRHDAWLMVDEAHGMGVLGPTGRGVAEAQGIDPQSVEIWMGTLSKTLAGCGGYISGSRALIDILKFSAPGFVFSVGISAPVAAAALAALEVMEAEPERVERLQANGRRLLASAREAGLDTGLSQGSAVTPAIIGDSIKAIAVSHFLLQKGVSVLPITHPAVPERQARLRFFLTSEHNAAQIDEAVGRTVESCGEVDRLVAELTGQQADLTGT